MCLLEMFQILGRWSYRSMWCSFKKRLIFPVSSFDWRPTMGKEFDNNNHNQTNIPNSSRSSRINLYVLSSKKTSLLATNMGNIFAFGHMNIKMKMRVKSWCITSIDFRFACFHVAHAIFSFFTTQDVCLIYLASISFLFFVKFSD